MRRPHNNNKVEAVIAKPTSTAPVPEAARDTSGTAGLSVFGRSKRKMGLLGRAVNSRSGSTIAELLLMVMVLGLLVLVVIMSWTVSEGKSREAACRKNLRALDAAISSYRRDHKGSCPTDLESLVPRYLKNGFTWHCPSGNYDNISGDYRDHYNRATGRATCPWPRHNP